MTIKVKGNTTPPAWKGLDVVIEALAFVIVIPLIPLAATIRAVSRLKQLSARAETRRQIELTLFELEKASQIPVSFTKNYFNRSNELYQMYQLAPWQNQAHAEAGYQIVLLAQTALEAQARADFTRITAKYPLDVT
jgi:hypothetical protein